MIVTSSTDTLVGMVATTVQYLFAAIDARQGRLQSNGRTGGIARPKYDAAELKQLIAEASEGVVCVPFTGQLACSFTRGGTALRWWVCVSLTSCYYLETG